MIVFRGFKQKAPAATALTIGNFDGLHLGHRALLDRLKSIAACEKLIPAVITFEPHPREFFSPETAPNRLTTLKEKLEGLKKERVALVSICRFDPAFAAMSPEKFVQEVLIDKMRVKHLIVGDDFCFGAARRGNIQTLREAALRNDFSIESMQSVVCEGIRVSSSAVRDALSEGNLTLATRLLGAPYSIEGRVITGKKLGKTLGFATANIRIKQKRPPLQGVFVVKVLGIGDSAHYGVANLGFRPSVSEKPQALLEVHLFDFSGNIYGKRLNVRFEHRLRDERKFADLAGLKQQIADDVVNAKNFLND